jgi:hypothetical protein
MQRGQGPFVGCTNCPLKCLFRSEVNVLLSEKNREWLNNELNSEGYETEEEQYEAAADAATHIVQSWQSYDLDAEPTERTPMISYCATLHVIAQAGYSEYEQSMMSEPISEILFSVGQEEDEQEDEYEYEEE